MSAMPTFIGEELYLGFPSEKWMQHLTVEWEGNPHVLLRSVLRAEKLTDSNSRSFNMRSTEIERPLPSIVFAHAKQISTG